MPPALWWTVCYFICRCDCRVVLLRKRSNNDKKLQAKNENDHCEHSVEIETELRANTPELISSSEHLIYFLVIDGCFVFELFSMLRWIENSNAEEYLLRSKCWSFQFDFMVGRAFYFSILRRHEGHAVRALIVSEPLRSSLHIPTAKPNSTQILNMASVSLMLWFLMVYETSRVFFRFNVRQWVRVRDRARRNGRNMKLDVKREQSVWIRVWECRLQFANS